MLWSWNVKLTAATYIKLNIFILLTTVNIQCSECYLLIICCFNYLSVHILTTPKLRKTDRKECLVFTTGHKWLFQTFLQFLFHHFLHHFHITSHYYQKWFGIHFNLLEFIVFGSLLHTVCFWSDLILTSSTLALCTSGYWLMRGEE